ncbi:DMT family transporter [Fulvimarina sp. 2208YS6-2-32]|uniref:DMT family transporter n=1 Tax=Fulvimarina uroteuthidis TaxID=3098149 RepID=A0ABU5I4W6_9HYPH|nr:DMT family transporter [Fulvimarina sp. 2208YS6-2-32]MDY8110428.1 DMT family transporter [Fulvimarina sp. 2208YS6-2-32]
MWIEITVAAAFMQNFRSALQKRLTSDLSTTGATFVRFGFGLPFAGLYLLLLHSVDYAIPAPDETFLWYVLLASLSQIAGTALLVLAFSYRNFMAATVYSKTEPIVAALFGFLILGDTLALPGLVAIGVGLLGVAAMSIGDRGTLRQMVRSSSLPSAAIGLSSGVGFAISGIAVRGAALSLGTADPVAQAALTLVCVIALQTVLMVVFIVLVEVATFRAILRVWKVALATGFCGAAASIGWFTAMALQPVALVKTVGQIELVFAYLASIWWFRESISRKELLGCALVILAVLILIRSGS